MYFKAYMATCFKVFDFMLKLKILSISTIGLGQAWVLSYLERAQLMVRAFKPDVLDTSLKMTLELFEDLTYKGLKRPTKLKFEDHESLPNKA